MRTTLTREEKETIIIFDETPADAIIFTYNKTWQRHLEKKLGIKPTMTNGYGAKEYHIPKDRVRMPQAPRKLSAEQKRKMGQRLKEARLQKLANTAKNNAATRNSHVKNFSEGKTINRTKTKTKNPQKILV